MTHPPVAPIETVPDTFADDTLTLIISKILTRKQRAQIEWAQAHAAAGTLDNMLQSQKKPDISLGLELKHRNIHEEARKNNKKIHNLIMLRYTSEVKKWGISPPSNAKTKTLKLWVADIEARVMGNIDSTPDQRANRRKARDSWSGDLILKIQEPQPNINF